jgi:hypothetical protein
MYKAGRFRFSDLLSGENIIAEQFYYNTESNFMPYPQIKLFK